MNQENTNSLTLIAGNRIINLITKQHYKDQTCLSINILFKMFKNKMGN